MKRTKASLRILQGITGIIIIAVIIIAVNLIGNFLLRNYKIDLTEENLYTLTPGTVNIINSTEPDNKITFKYFYSKTDAAEIPFLNLYADRVEDLLQEYTARSKGKIKLEIYNPRPDTETEEWAVRYGIKGIPVSAGTNIYFGLVITDELDHEATIAFFDPSREEFLEYDVSKALYTVLRPQQKTIGVISDLPVMGNKPNNQLAMQQMSPDQYKEPWTCIAELKKLYQVEDLGVEVEEIPEDIDVLLIVHPKNLSPKVNFAIDQYILNGGNAFIFVDPLCEIDTPVKDPNNPYAALGANRSSDLPGLFSSWGLVFSKEKVVGDKESATTVGFGQGIVGETIVWLTLGEKFIDKDDMVTGNLEELLLVDVGAFTITEKEGIKVLPLVHSSKQSSEISNSEVLFAKNPGYLLKDFTPGFRELPMILRVQGKFKTAFPGGKPEDKNAALEITATETETKEDKKEAVKTYLKESSVAANLIIVGDVDCLADQFSVRVNNLFGYKLVTQINDNLTFFLNGIENLTGSSDLISIRSRGKSARPFTKVKEIEARAAATWKSREEELQQKLDAANERLRKLRAPQEQDKEGKQVFDQTLVSEIQRFQEEKAETMRSLREVKKNLRQEKEKLGNLLFVFNAFFIPLIVFIIGIIVWLLRRRSVRL